ncbi:glycosyltransferase family 4 protein [Skermanella stibiiresistens]|nr:glycosyltransferase family 4 protein [Skermanella stibiiresistens]
MDVRTVPRRSFVTEPAAGVSTRVVFFVSEDWWFCLHWLNLAKRLAERGYRITVICNTGASGADRARIERAGFEVVPLKLDRSGLNILNDFRIASALVKYLRRERPALIHCVGMKPILIGTLAARLVGAFGPPIRILDHFAGLGYLFSSSHLKARLLRPLVMLGMRAAFAGHEVHLVTMNPTDRDVLMRWQLRRAGHVHVIGGTGLDLARYPALPFPKSETVTIAITTRMIEDKGLAPLVEAFRRVRAKLPHVELLLVGERDGRNPTAIPRDQLEAWSREPGITWLGHVDRVAEEVWARAHIAVLPSRREGLPVSLLEAAACGRPMVATDVPGCRDVVIDGVTGLLVPPEESGELVQGLADALERLAASDDLRRRFGAAAREMVETRYSLSVISDHVAGLYRSLIDGSAEGSAPGSTRGTVVEAGG